MTQQRWLCADCGREWLGLTETLSKSDGIKWQPADGCPGCHSLAIAEVVYTPEFRGADIPRTAASVVTAAQRAALDAEPPAPPVPRFDLLPHLAQNTAVTDEERRLLALALSSPEFG